MAMAIESLRVEFEFQAADGQASDTKQFRTGVRQFTYSEEGGALRIFINGRRFVPRGGNWGFSEDLLRYRAREYDAAVRYHRDMNFTMIRNLGGANRRRRFLRGLRPLRDRGVAGVLAANPWDGPIRTIRRCSCATFATPCCGFANHPSIVFIAAAMKAYPPAVIDDGIRQALGELAPRSHYISDSADGVVGGGGHIK